MKIFTFPLGQLRANCYFLIKEDKCLIIDPADEASFILEEIQRRKLSPLALLATHGHFDHLMAAGEIQLSFKVPLYASNKDLFLVKRINKTAEYYLGYNPNVVEPKITASLEPGRFKIGSFELETILTAGHTPGGASFYFNKDKALFTGDTLFRGSVGRFDFSYSSKADLKKSLEELFKLPKETIVYPGHGESTKIGNERSLLQLID